MNYIKIDSPRSLFEKDKNNQEKKKSIDLSTTNASNKIILNLSNPTNLTNPIIIAKSKRYKKDDSNENSILSNREYKINKLNEYNKLIFSINNQKIKASKSELNLLNEGTNGHVIKINNTKKILKPFDTKRQLNRTETRNLIFFPNYMPKRQKGNNSSKNEINFNPLLSPNYNKFKNNLDISEQKDNNSEKKEDIENNKDKKIELNPIWEKLKNSKLFNSIEKEIRIERTKFIKKFDYLDKKRQINYIKNDINIKNDRYNKIINMNSSEINALEKLANNLTKSTDNIQKNYYDNFVSNIINLSLKVEKEKLIASDYLIDKNSLIKQIAKLEKKINKLREEKNNILKWIYLQIKIKEKTITLPLYYKDIIENENSFESIIKKYKLKGNALTEIKYNKIKEYKEKLIFKNINELEGIYHSLENRIFFYLNKKLDIINEVKQLKQDLEYSRKIEKEKEEKEEEEEQKENEKDDKKENNKKVKMTFEEKEENFIKKLKKLKFENNELNEEYSKIKHFKLLLDNRKDDRNLENYKNELEVNKPTLFSISMNLYEEEIKANFNIENKIRWKYSLTEERMILDILKYTEKILNFLFEEKIYYNSDEKLKMQYKLISDKIEKETKNKKLVKQLELQEQLLTERKEKIKQRLNNRNYFKPYRKVDFEYYLRQKSKYKNKSIGNVKKDDNYLQYLFY